MFKKNFSLHDRIIGVLFLIPTVGILIFTSLYPLIYSLFLSFFELNLSVSLEQKFVGFQNYINAFRDTRFTHSLIITIIFVLLTVGIELILGLIIALLLSREGKRLRLMRSIILIPMVMAPVVVGTLWRILLNSEIGIINYIFTVLRLQPLQWLANPNMAFISIMITDVWEWTPFMVLCLVSGITALPSDINEAAFIDGASSFQAFRYILLPLLSPVILVTVLLRVLDAFKIFDIVYVMTFGGPSNATELVSFFIYRQGLKYFNIGYASAISWIFIIFMLIFTYFFIRRRQRSIEY